MHAAEGLKQALNATEIFFGNTEALHKLSGMFPYNIDIDN